MKHFMLTVVSLFFFAIVFNSCKHTVPVNTYCFEREVLPIITSNCNFSGCHNANDAAGGYILDSYANIVKHGVVRGNAAASSLYQSILPGANEHMPTSPYPALDDMSINRIKTWINEGARNTSGCNAACNAVGYTFSKDVLPILRINCYGCHSTVAAPDFGGGYELSDYATISDLGLNGLLVRSIEHDPLISGMPKSLAQLTTCQINTIKKWVAAGAPNN
jgi:Planctomycete cytochrome C